MIDTSGKINYKGKEYRLVFNLNVMEAIQVEYGSVSRWGELTEGGESGEPDIKALKYGFAAMINEGIDIENEDNGTDTAHVSPPQVGRMLSEIGYDQVAEVLRQTVIDSTQSEEKNG